MSAPEIAAPSGFAAVQACAVPGIAFRAATSATSSTGSVTIPLPAGTRSGDLLIVHFTQCGRDEHQPGQHLQRDVRVPQLDGEPDHGGTGYRLERVVSGSVTRTWTVTPISATSTTDPELTNATTYT